MLPAKPLLPVVTYKAEQSQLDTTQTVTVEELVVTEIISWLENLALRAEKQNLLGVKWNSTTPCTLLKELEVKQPDTCLFSKQGGAVPVYELIYTQEGARQAGTEDKGSTAKKSQYDRISVRIGRLGNHQANLFKFGKWKQRNPFSCNSLVQVELLYIISNKNNFVIVSTSMCSNKQHRNSVQNLTKQSHSLSGPLKDCHE